MRTIAITKSGLALACSLLLAALVMPAHAEDIDIYSQPNGNGDRPNVLFILDDSANWSSSIPAADCYYKDSGRTTTEGPTFSNPGQEQGKKVAIEKCALYNLLDALAVSDTGGPDNDALFNIGFMLLNESPNNGAYPRKAFTPLTTNNRASLKALIKSLNILDDKGSNADFSKAMYEAYLYFKGLAPYQGQLAPKRDPAAFLAGRYKSDLLNSCARDHIIFIANGSPQGSENNDAKALLQAAGGNISPISYPTSVVKSTDQANWMDEYSRFLRGVDVSTRDGLQGIVTHTVAVVGAVERRPLSELHGAGRQAKRRHLPQRQ